MEKRFPIVGQSFRPPALAILDSIATNTRLWLRPEPQNPVDASAKAVWIKTADLSDRSLAVLDDGRLKLFGLSITNILAAAEWQLGYIPATMNKFPLASEVPGTFSVSADGKLRLTIALED